MSSRFDKDLSATEVSMGRACLRKWAAKYCCDDPQWKEQGRPGHFAVGTAYHKLAEVYAEHGFVPRDPHPVIDMFLHSMRYLPVPKSHWALEHKARVRLEGLPFELTPDWYGPSAALPQADPSKKIPAPLIMPKGLRALVDYKTSKDPSRYGIFEAPKKLDDVQTLLYSHVAFGDEPGVFRHLYMRKTGQILVLEAQESPEQDQPRLLAAAAKQAASQLCIPSDVLLQPADVRGAMERIVLPVGERLFRIRSRGINVNPLDLPPNTGHCFEYGGCPHRGRACKTTTQDALANLGGYDVTGSGFNLFANIPAVNGAPQTQAPAAPAQGFGFAAAPSAPAPSAFMSSSAPTPPPAPPPPVPEELPPGYSPSEGNPDFLKSPDGMYAPKAEVLKAWAAHKIANAPAPAPIRENSALAQAAPEYTTKLRAAAPSTDPDAKEVGEAFIALVRALGLI